MTRTYAIADLHGRRDLLDAALDRIETSPSGGTVVFLGDYVDRGPNSKGVIERLMAGPTKPEWKWVVLSGNHDEWFADAALEGKHTPYFDSWIQFGGYDTLLSYGQPRTVHKRDLDPKRWIPKTHAQWAKRLPFTYQDEHRVYVHGGIDPTTPIGNQKKDTVHWWRWDRSDNIGFYGKHIVHGHTPNERGPDLRSNRTNLDTLAWYTGRLTIGVFDDEKPGGPVEIWTVTI